MTLSARLEDVTLVDAQTGEDRALGSLWADRRALLVFLRHFG